MYELRELTIPKVLKRQVDATPDKCFVRELATGRSFSYLEFDQWSNRISNALASLGLSKGAHIGVLMANSAEHIAAFFGIGKRGCVSVPINTSARGELLRYFLAQSDCKAIVVDASLLGRLSEVLPELLAIEFVLVAGSDDELVAAGASAACSRKIINLRRLVEQASVDPAGENVRCSDLLMLAYTSGTTGPSKGSMLSHAAALTYGTGAADAQGYRASDIFYVCLPLFHNNALLAATGAALVVGGTVALSPRFSVGQFWSDVRESGATITNLLGAMPSFLWASAPSPTDTDNDLRLVSMSPTPKFAREFEARFGLTAMTNYGLSDFGMATSFTEHDPREKLGSIGRVRRGMRVKIVDDDDFEVPQGTIGEIVLRCEEPWRATTGYYNMPEATIAAHRNQWFHTGDRGRYDADGYLWFVDRKKDCIRRRGENISAFEVEQIICTNPAVAAAAVFPVATEANDEEVGAVIVRRAGAQISEEDVVRHCQANMSYFMVPRYIEFRDELPMTVNQKVEKFKLRQELEANPASRWDREAAGIVLER